MLVLTPLSPVGLSAQTIMALYRCRWQVESATFHLMPWYMPEPVTIRLQCQRVSSIVCPALPRPHALE